MSFLDKIFIDGHSMHHQWNKKLCYEARDTLLGCVDR